MSKDLNPELNWLDALRFNDDGLIAAIAQDIDSGVVLMQAWMNRESLQLTVETGKAVYWSRSRNRLWRKGEESGHRQKVIEIRIDCDADTILLIVEQHGAACHEGYPSCFFRKKTQTGWEVVQERLVDPTTLYNKSQS